MRHKRRMLLCLPWLASGLSALKTVKRSYMRRRGHRTKAQKRALREMWPRYGVDLPRTAPSERRRLDTALIFGRDAPLILDVGHGLGESVVALAQAFPACNVLGCEVHVPGATRGASL